jgi:hypothetical protein
MQLEFSTKQMMTAMKAVKKIFDKGPFADADATSDDCLVASLSDGNALLESASGGLYTRVTFPADVKQEGRVAISRLALHALRLQGERSTFTHTSGSRKMKFKSGQFQGELSVGEAFDEIEAARPAEIPELTISMPALVAKAASKRTCLNTTLDTLLRMRLQVADGKMTLSCNDSFRAAAVRANLSDDAWGDGEIEVPAVFFNTVLQSIEDQQIRFGFNDQVFRVCGGGFDVCHPTMQENDKPMADVFGKFEQLKKQKPYVIATIGATAIRDAITAVTSVAPVGSGAEVKVDLSFSKKNGGQLTTSLQSAISKGKYTFGLQSLQSLDDGNDTITMNAKFLQEMFNLMGTDDADLYAWEQLVVLHSEKVGCCMIMPQIMS